MQTLARKLAQTLISAALLYRELVLSALSIVVLRRESAR